jgi:hypothetical protein
MWSRFRTTEGLLALALLVSLAGCSANHVWGVAASPDGRRVEVVGARVNTFYNPPTPIEPLRWVCIRGTDDRLTCQMDRSPLPKAD